MTRPLRIEFPGAVYHVTSRGNARDNIYLKDEDRSNFLQILSNAIERYNWLCHAFCLMDNHYHLLIETIDPNLSLGMRHLNGVYTQSFNRRYHRVGHVFQGRYKAILVQKDAHLIELCRYIVLNPVKAGMVDKPGDWKWSSYNSTISNNHKTDFLTTDWILGQFSATRQVAQEEYKKFVEHVTAEESLPWEHLKGQIFLGSDDFVNSMKRSQTNGEKIKEIPKVQRFANRMKLEDLFKNITSKQSRNAKIWEAHVKCGYKMREIAEYLSIHYTTVSKVINLMEK